MHFSTKSLMLMALLAAAPAFAADDAQQPVTITVNWANGAYTQSNSAKTFARDWVSTATDPTLTVDVAVNNISVATSGNLRIYTGQALTCTMAMTASDGWFVSAYSFTATNAEANITFTHNGNTSTISQGGADVTVSETLTQSQTPEVSFTATSNSPVTFSNFTVTLTPRDPNDPALTLTPAPADEVYAGMKVTNVVNGAFNDFTTWYHLLSGSNFLTGADLADAGSSVERAYGDEYLYCVVKNGAAYALYNKAAGVATPVAGAVLTTDKVTVDGSDVTANFAQKLAPVAVAQGKFTRADGTTLASNMWQGIWTSNAEPTVIFRGSKNNMTTSASSSSLVASGDFKLETGETNGGNFTWSFEADNDNYIAAYTFLAVKSTTNDDAVTVTPNGATAVTLSQYTKRISGEGFNDLKPATFVENAKNGKGMLMKDVYVTVRRDLAYNNKRAATVLFPNQGVERRIPAIACVGEGAHKGRLVAIFDYRHNGGDVGFNGNISLQIVKSDDNGATWSEPDYLRDAEGEAVSTFPDSIAVSKHNMAYYQKDANLYWNFAFGDAALVADRESGRLLLMAVGGPTTLWNSRYDNPNQVVRWYSEDGGETWSEAQRITYDILDLFKGEPVYGKIDGQFIASGRIMQSRYVKLGDYYRLYCVSSTQNNGNQGTTRNFVLYSDDFGKNWAVLGGYDVCPVATGDGDECKAEELPDGSVLLAGRRRLGNRNFNIFRYTDVTNGKGVWLNHVVTDMGYGSINACNGEILIIPAKDNISGQACYLALQSFPYGGGRNHVSIAYKGLKTPADIATPQSFTSWDGRFRVFKGSSTYSTMVMQNNNKLAFFYEQGSPISGVYIDFTIDEITNGRYSYQPDEKNATAIKLSQELLDQRSKGDFTSLYVGQPVRSFDMFDETVEDYFNKPSYNTYVKANKLEYEGNGVIPLVNNGEYRLLSAHNGTYTYGDRVLAASSTTLTSANTDNLGDNSLFKVTESDGAYKLYNKAANVYVANTPAATNTKVPVTATESEAGLYKIVSNLKGESNLTCTTPGNSTYGALHLDGSQNIVIWLSDRQASQWYMELVNAPEGYIPPVPAEPEYDDYDFDYEKNAPVDKTQDAIEAVPAAKPAGDFYYDLQGRRVAHPANGIFISNTGRKIAL